MFSIRAVLAAGCVAALCALPQAGAAADVPAATVASAPALAAPAPWYWWRSQVDGARVCAQTSPGPGWQQDSAPFDGPGCRPRTRVLVLPPR